MTPAVAGGRVVCEVASRGRLAVGEPFFEPGPALTLGPWAALGAAAPGDLVAVESDGRGRGRLDQVLGRPDDAAAVMLALAVEARVAESWPTAAEAEADAPPPATAGRVDLRGLFTFTIDPEGAKDHDDALSVGDDGRIFVHIADVAAHVPPGSSLDAEAVRRSTSVYLPGRVDPMLPPRLSDDRCSLRADADRLAVTIELGPGDAVAAHRSIIRSRHTLTYPQAQAILDGDEAAPELERALRRAAEAARELRRARMRSGALAIDSAEVEVDVGPDGPTAAPRTLTAVHGVIEELMILANRRVAERLAAARRPALHRVHEPPEAAAVEALVERLDALDVPTPAAPPLHGGPETARYAGRLSAVVGGYARASGRGREAFPALVLRAMQKARYDASPHGHSGLAARHYCHFTSPIRRYPDLVCHRALLRDLGLERGAGPDPDDLARLAVHASEAERGAERLERRGTAVCLAFLLQRRLYDEGWDAVWPGEVVGLIEAGAFVRFGEVFEGFLPGRLWRGERVALDALGVSLVAASGRRLRLGDPVDVVVESIERPRGRVLLRAAAT